MVSDRIPRASPHWWKRERACKLFRSSALAHAALRTVVGAATAPATACTGAGPPPFAYSLATAHVHQVLYARTHVHGTVRSVLRDLVHCALSTVPCPLCALSCAARWTQTCTGAAQSLYPDDGLRQRRDEVPVQRRLQVRAAWARPLHAHGPGRTHAHGLGPSLEPAPPRGRELGHAHGRSHTLELAPGPRGERATGAALIALA